MQSQSTTRFFFRNLTLAEAEVELVGAAIDLEHALLTALETLAVDDFRSERAADLRRIFYVLAGWYAKGRWDPLTNRERLQRYSPDVWIDGLWCPSGVIPEYVRDLCRAVTESNRLADDAVAATRAWQEQNPIGVWGHPGAQRPATGPRGGVA